jgi:hypothetical protein
LTKVGPTGHHGRIRTKILILILFLTGTVAGARVKVYPSKTLKITDYKTYQWLPVRMFTKYQGLLEDDPDIAPLVREAVNRELAKKGYMEVKAGGDLHVLAAGTGTDSQTIGAAFVTYSWDHYWGYGTQMVSTTADIHREGTLAIGLVDPKLKKGVWCGYATEALGEPRTIGKTINKAAGNLLKKLPARQ